MSMLRRQEGAGFRYPTFRPILTESVVQTTFALLLELATHVGLHDASVKSGEWINCPDHSYWKTSLLELDGLTLGIVGYGTIGRAVARVGAAFGMRIIAYAPRIPQDTGSVRSVLSPWKSCLHRLTLSACTAPRPRITVDL